MTMLTAPQFRRLPYAALPLALTLALTTAPAAAQQTTEGQQSDEAATLDVVTVQGIRRSIESAQALKRDSVQIIDSIVASDLDKMPDLTVSASLARVPGIQVSRGGAEASGVLVRGLPNLTTTYNGREMFTAENRGYGFQDLPTGGVGRVDVYKSGTADLIEGGIAGSIDVHSRKPFEFSEGRQMSGSWSSMYADQSDLPGFNANFLYSNRWKTKYGEMGFLINASKNRIRYLDSTREQSIVMLYKQAVDAPDDPAFFIPDWHGVFFGDGDRRRPSANMAFQWRPDDNWEISADAVFMGYRSRGYDRFLQIPLWNDATEFSQVTTVPGIQGPRATLATANAGTGTRPEGYQRTNRDRTDNYQVGITATYQSEAWFWSFDASWIDSKYKNQEYSVDYAYTSIPARDLVMDIDDGGRGSSTVSFRDFDHLDLSNYLWRGIYETNYHVTGGANQWRADMKYMPASGIITAIQSGVRRTHRDADRYSVNQYAYTEPMGIMWSELPLDFSISNRGFDGDGKAPIRNWITPTFGSIRTMFSHLRGLAGAEWPFDPTTDLDLGIPQFVGKEQSEAAYGQLMYELNPGFIIDGAVGIRAVKTKTAMWGLYDQREWRVRNSKYTDWLPNASMRLRFFEEFQVRLAATRTRTRPNFPELNSTTTFGRPSTVCIEDPRDEDCIMGSSSGNPDLKPLRSSNYDMTAEYYFSPTGSLTLSLFKRNVEGFIFGMTSDVPDPDGVYNFIRHSQPENSGKGKLQGVEMGFSAFLDWDRLPEWTKAFGTQANFTYIDHCIELNPFLAESMPGCVSIPGVAKNAYNVVLMYERPKFSARLGYNWRGKVVYFGRVYDPVERVTGPTLPETHQEYEVFDFSMRYRPRRNLSFSFDLSNVLRRPLRYARQFNLEGDSFPYRIRVQERMWSLGMQFHF